MLTALTIHLFHVENMKVGMHGCVATTLARSRVKSLQWWGDQNLITGNITTKHLRRGLRTTWPINRSLWFPTHCVEFPTLGYQLQPDTAYNIQESRKLSASMHSYDVEEGMTDEEMLQGNPEDQW